MRDYKTELDLLLKDSSTPNGEKFNGQILNNILEDMLKVIEELDTSNRELKLANDIASTKVKRLNEDRAGLQMHWQRDSAKISIRRNRQFFRYEVGLLARTETGKVYEIMHMVDETKVENAVKVCDHNNGFNIARRILEDTMHATHEHAGMQGVPAFRLLLAMLGD